MNTRKVTTYYPDKWTRSRRGDVVTYTSKNPNALGIADAVAICDEIGTVLVTGHVVHVDADAWPIRYGVRVNVNHSKARA